MEKKKLRLLYAEDDPFSAEITKKILEREGFEVQIAPDGVKAWQAYKDWKPDLLLLDLDMPRKDGLKLTRQIRAIDPQTHITIYTNHSDPTKEADVMKAGADDFISKDKEPQVFISHINRIRDKIQKGIHTPYVYRLSTRTRYNSATQELTIDEETTKLTSGNLARLLQALAAKHPETAEKEFLIHAIWENRIFSKDDELKKYVSLLRARLEADPSIQINYDGQGYLLSSDL